MKNVNRAERAACEARTDSRDCPIPSLKRAARRAARRASRAVLAAAVDE